MSLSLIHELDSPKYPLTVGEESEILNAAEIGSTDVAEAHDRHFLGIVNGSFQTAMTKEAPISFTFTPVHFIGYTIGVRAGLRDKSVETFGSEGFDVDGIGLTHVRQGKTAGVQAAGIGRADRTFEDIIAEALKTAGRGETLLRSPEHLIGYSIGVRLFQLEGARV